MGLRDRLAFLTQMRADFHHTGAVQPSSRYLARAMTRPLCQAGRSRARRLLEIGPGTGPVTREIARCMGSEDSLVCYEINPEFARLLESLVSAAPEFASVRDVIRIHNAPVQELEADEPFDFVVCSAPLNNFDADTIEEIFSVSFAALRDEGTFTFFGYALFPALKRLASRAAARQSIDVARATKARWLSRYETGSGLVLRNIPPARVHYLRKTSR